jgi:hypothetical protein
VGFSMSDDDDGLVWGIPSIAEVIDRKVDATYHLAAKGVLPVTKIGGKYVGRRSELRDPRCWPRAKDD